MKQLMYCIFDMAANESGPVLVCKNDAVAKRAFRTALTGQDSRDYRLYRVGTYDPETIEIKGITPVEISPTALDEENKE